MTKTIDTPLFDTAPRKNMMRVMSEVSFNPANVSPICQEELASFMVEHLKTLPSSVTQLSDKWIP
jgi:hypothetical protein